jgi:hypothetical protein
MCRSKSFCFKYFNEGYNNRVCFKIISKTVCTRLDTFTNEEGIISVKMRGPIVAKGPARQALNNK